ncbi:MAG TPA: FAD-dependent monooxygenase [Terriglobales bacterium]|nr:FAD-dependent monooxygenase [Terriglobales bacterium]
MDGRADIVIVGGGFAGAAMATTLSRAGVHVILLERQSAYRDRVRGELLVPWGVEESRKLGLLDALLDAGGHWLTTRIPYDETLTLEEAEATALPLDRLLPGIPGALSFFQPAACLALSRAAEAAGTALRMGVQEAVVTAGAQPEVAYRANGMSAVVRCGLVIGADGRTSSVRGQAGIALERQAGEHLISGLLVDDASPFRNDVFLLGTEGDVSFFVCPQGSGRARLYLCHALHPHDRFAGAGGPAAFLRAYRLRSVPQSDSLAGATVAGPCATLEGDDTWTAEPFVEGVALIGDAAGYNNPLIGQGLSLALRDVRVLSEILLGGSDWSPPALRPYAVERAVRMRRVRVVASAFAGLVAQYTPDTPGRRRAFRERIATDRTLAAPMMAMYAGPETAPPEAFSPGFIERFTGAGITRH